MRLAMMEADNEFMQKPAMKDESRQYLAFKYKPFAERHINISGNYETGDTSAIPVDRLAPLETLSLFLDDPFGTRWPSTMDGQIANAAGRRINDTFNAYRAGNSATHLGLDADGNDIPTGLYFNQHLHRNGWMAVFDGSTGRTDGLADYGIDTGWRGGVNERAPYFNPTNHNFAGASENVIVRNLSMADIAGDFEAFEGYRAVGLMDYEVFDFRRNLYCHKMRPMSMRCPLKIQGAETMQQ